MNINLTKNFTLQELTNSSTAKFYNLDNTPPMSAVIALSCLAVATLQPLRDALKIPLRINSGYRSEELNRKIKGSQKSQHMAGEAADIACDYDAINIVNALLNNGIPFDQCILYARRNFVHISYRRIGGNRHKLIYQ